MSTRRKLQSSPTSGETSRRACARAIALRWQRRTSRERLAESESDKEIYLRFAVSINERLNSGIDQIMTAREIARQLARESADGKRLPERPAAP